MQTKILVIALLITLSFGGWQYLSVERLSATLNTERAEHSALLKQIRAERDAALASGQGWIEAYGALSQSLESQKINAQACFERELTASQDQAARTEILSRARPQPRSELEKKQVVDDATRRAAALRLNRIW